MYIITNRTLTGEYTPSKADTLKEAKAWLLECTADNIRSYMESEVDEIEYMTDKEVVKWAKENLSEFVFDDDGKHSYIKYGDGSCNEMRIYKM